MKKNFKIIFLSLLVFLFIIIGFSYHYYTSVEYSMYQMFNHILSGDITPDVHISTKCKYSIETEIPAADKAMFEYILGIKEIKKDIPCQEYLMNEDCMMAHVLNEIHNSTNNLRLQRKRLLDFIVKKEANYYDNAYGYSYSCKDNDKDEKVCSIFNNDDVYENLHFKKVNSQWLLVDIDYRSL